MPQPENAPQIMIARSDATVRVDGVEVVVRSGESTAFPTDPIVRDNPDLWVLFEGHYEGDDDTSGDEPGDDPELVDEHPPAAKDVREWAKANNIEVPARGKIPDDVVARYLEAQGGNKG